MKKLSGIDVRVTFCFCLLILLESVACFGQLKEGVVNVLFSETASKQQLHKVVQENGKQSIEFIHSDVKRLFAGYKVTKFTRTYPGVEKYKHPNAAILSRYYTIEGNFKRDRIMYNILTDGDVTLEDVEPVTEESVALVPNDYSAYSVHLDQVNAVNAWNITQGSRTVKVAVSDPKGFYFAHPDYVNANGTNQIVYRSPAAIDLSQSTQTAYDHGLNVASIVAAATHNGKGISAIGYKTALMAFSADYNELLTASYDQGADVIVMSWSGSCSFASSQQLIMDMIHDNGTVIVVAAGNGNLSKFCSSSDGRWNGYQYPASYNNVISVGGVDENDKYERLVLGVWQNFTFNDAVDLTAPGYNVGALTVTRNADLSVNSFTQSTKLGTSVAAPMVGGLAALILSVKPDLSPNQVESIIKSTAVNIDNLPGNALFAGKAGAGRIDAFAAVQKTRYCYACEETSAFPQYDEMGQLQPIPFLVDDCKIRISAYTVMPNEAITIRAGREIVLRPGFTSLAGSNVQLKINDLCKNEGSNIRKGGTSYGIEHVSYQQQLLSGEIPIPDEPVSSDEVSFDLQTYPNPTSTNISARYTVNEVSDITITVSDLNGNTIMTLFNGSVAAGTYEANLNTSTLKSGTYLLVLKSNEGRKVERFSVIR
ncbi:MAG: S8 family serine peptidase [Chryseolinea sp.]